MYFTVKNESDEEQKQLYRKELEILKKEKEDEFDYFVHSIAMKMNTFIFEDRMNGIFKIGNVFESKNGLVAGLKQGDADYIFKGHMGLSPPYVCVDNTALANICGNDGCGNIGKLLCSKCMNVAYCNKKCQTNCCF